MGGEKEGQELEWGDKGMGSGIAGYGKREVLTPAVPLPSMRGVL